MPARNSSNGVGFSVLRQECIGQKFHMQLRCVSAGNVFSLRLLYDRGYFSPTAAERVGRCLSTLIKSAAQKPASAIADLDMMSDAERQQVVAEFNRTAADYPRDKALHYLFEEQAAKAADQAALRFGETVLTYAELNARANQLAHRLRKDDVRQDVAVGLCLDRSAEMIIALLGIMKAGGAYVPLIPDNLHLGLDGRSQGSSGKPRQSRELRVLHRAKAKRGYRETELCHSFYAGRGLGQYLDIPFADFRRLLARHRLRDGNGG
jgi:hypothetical protein